MKAKNKSKIPLLILPLLFLALHYFGYMTESLDGLPILTSPEPMPFDVANLELEKEFLPDYLDPFQILERHYLEKGTGEVVVIEKGSFISTDMNFTMGDPTAYFEADRPENMFLRGFAVDDYPNTIFFLIQYLLLISFVSLSTKEILKLSK